MRAVLDQRNSSIFFSDEYIIELSVKLKDKAVSRGGVWKGINVIVSPSGPILDFDFARKDKKHLTEKQLESIKRDFKNMLKESIREVKGPE